MADIYNFDRKTIRKWLLYDHDNVELTGTIGHPATLDVSHEKAFLDIVTERQKKLHKNI